jgi:hypothetical protein
MNYIKPIVKAVEGYFLQHINENVYQLPSAKKGSDGV